MNAVQTCPLTYHQLDVPGIEVVKTWHMLLHILQNAHQTTHTGEKQGQIKGNKSGDQK